MEQHVFAVWDFMSVVKSLQRELTCIQVPWIPPPDIEAARLINEIVLCEECDKRPDGSFTSHYQLYLEAMKEAGADTSKIERLVSQVATGRPLAEALEQYEVSPPARRFVEETFSIIEGTPLHVRAAALLFGREDLIPGMFKAMVGKMRDSGLPVGKFVYYLERHIEIDGDVHSAMAERILSRLCGKSEHRKEEARQSALRVLRSRLDFWDGIQNLLPDGGPPS